MAGSWPEEKPLLMAAAEHYFIKTHDYPEDEERAIVIVRDPRATIVSYWHYLNEIEGQSISLETVAKGLCGFGGWNAFYSAWQPQCRANTLLLHYEELFAETSKSVARISGFTGFKPNGPWNSKFSKFNAIDPVFFRAGNNQANISELSPQLETLIISHCGPMMEKLGYQTPPPSPA